MENRTGIVAWALLAILAGASEARTDETPPIMPVPGDGPVRFALQPGRSRVLVTDQSVAMTMVDGGRGWGLHWSIAGARPVEPRPEGRLPGSVNYLVGAASRWATNLPTWSSLVCDEVRPGIDLVIESREHGFKYTLRAEAGADVSMVVLRYEGAQEVRIVEDGTALEIETGVALVRENGLVCSQDGCPVVARYAWARQTGEMSWEYAIELRNVDPRRPVEIDPVVEWSSFVGGSKEEYRLRLGVDAEGDVYVGGGTQSADLPVVGGYDATLEGTGDGFVTKIDAATRAIVWCTFLGGSTLEAINALAVDRAGRVCVAGETSSADFPTTPGAFQASMSGYTCAFVTMLDAGGAGLVWSTFLGGSANQYAEAVALGADGHVIVAGKTTSLDFPLRRAFDVANTSTRMYEAFVARFDAEGALDWSSYLGGASHELVAGVAVDGSGNVFVAGYTESRDFPTMNAIQPVMPGGGDGFVTKIDASGPSLLWSTYLGGKTGIVAGAGKDVATGIAVDPRGDAVVVGWTMCHDFPITGGFDGSLAGLSDGFVAKIRGDGTAIMWSSYFGGPVIAALETPQGVAADDGGFIFITGFTKYEGFPLVRPVDSKIAKEEAFLMVVYPEGDRVYMSTYLGGSGDDQGSGVCVDPWGDVYVAGVTKSADFAVDGGFDSRMDGTTDGFIVKIADPTPRPVLRELEQAALPGGAAVPPGFAQRRTSMVLRGVGKSPEPVSVWLQVEVKPEGVAFDGTGRLTGPEVPVGGWWSEIAVGPLELGAYHWRARVVDAYGYASRWVEFAPAAGADFVLLGDTDNANGDGGVNDAYCLGGATGGRAPWAPLILLALLACGSMRFSGGYLTSLRAAASGKMRRSGSCGIRAKPYFS